MSSLWGMSAACFIQVTTRQSQARDRIRQAYLAAERKQDSLGRAVEKGGEAQGYGEFDINNIKAIKKTKPAINQGMLGGSSYFSQEHLLKKAYNFRAAQNYWTAVASGS